MKYVGVCARGFTEMVQEPPGGDVGGDETPFPSSQMISGKGNSCRAGLCHYSNCRSMAERGS